MANGGFLLQFYSLQLMYQDDCEYVLLSLLMLFNPDMLNLVERKKVEEIQTKFVILLEKYLNRK